MSKQKFITRRVLESKTYDVYKMEGTQLTKLDTITTKGKVSEKELATKYNVDKVIIDCVAENKAIYGVPVKDFMEMAVLMAKDDIELEEQE